MTRAAALALAVAVAGCAPPTTIADAGGPPDDDAGALPDAGFAADAGAPADGGFVADAGGPPQGFGALSGACGVLDDELTTAAPALVQNRLDFGADPFDPEDAPLLTEGGQAMLAAGNAGGSSLESEVFAYEVLARCEGATLLKTETAIVYDAQGSITDLLVQIDGLKIGVSVVRAVAFPYEDPYDPVDARALMERKLEDIQESTANVSDEDRWTKQILSVIAYSDAHAEVVVDVLDQIDAAIRGDTVVVLTITDGDDAPLY